LGGGGLNCLAHVEFSGKDLTFTIQLSAFRRNRLQIRRRKFWGAGRLWRRANPGVLWGKRERGGE